MAKVTKQSYMKETLIFYSQNITSANEMLNISNSLRDEFEILHITDSKVDPNTNSTILKHGHQLISSEPKKSIFQALPTRLKKLLNTKNYLSRYLFKRKIRHNARMLGSLFGRYLKIRAVFVYGDFQANGIGLQLISAAKSREIEVILPPIGIFSIDSLIQARRDQADYLHNEKLYPELSKYSVIDPVSNKKYLFYPSWLSKILISYQIHPDNPWIPGGGASTQVWCDTVKSAERLLRDGCNQDKIRITGHLAFDSLSLINKSESSLFFSRYRSQNNKPNIVLALPQLAEHNLLPWEKHWEEIEFLLNSFSQLQANVYVSLHPKMNKEQYLTRCNSKGIIILNEKLKECLPYFDFFYATYSSTVSWALGLKIPVVIFDFYALNYDYFDNEGIAIFREKIDFVSKLKNLLEHRPSLDAYKSHIAEISTRFALIDGMCLQRMKNELYKIK